MSCSPHPWCSAGEIVALTDKTFELKVAKVYRGKYSDKETPEETIRVLRFQNWTCAQRWAPYAVGQHVFLCLKPIPTESGDESCGRRRTYRIQSAGGEGEMPIVGKHVYVHGPSGIKMKHDKHIVYGKPILAQKISLAQMERLLASRNKHEQPPATPKK